MLFLLSVEWTESKKSQPVGNHPLVGDFLTQGISFTGLSPVKEIQNPSAPLR
jgi:hypothetical protein